MVVPDANDGVFAFLCRSYKTASLGYIKAANWGGVAEEELLLLVSLHIHGNK